jgi:multicomponent Na+:H+ antiporter subunit G
VNGHTAAIDALLIAGTALTVACSIGVLVMPTVYDRIHYLGPVSVVVPVLIAAAVVVDQGLSPLGIKAMLVALLLATTGPIVGHATARAAAIHDTRAVRKALDDTIEDDET